jgi:hypothetical protein
MAESGLIQRPKRVDFRIVGKDRQLLKVTFDVDIGGSFLLKLEYLEKLKAGVIDRAYSPLSPDSEEYRNRWKKNGHTGSG